MERGLRDAVSSEGARVVQKAARLSTTQMRALATVVAEQEGELLVRARRLGVSPARCRIYVQLGSCG